MRIYVLSNATLKKNIISKLEPYLHNVRHICYIWSVNGLMQVEDDKIYQVQIKDVQSKKTLLGAFPVTIDESDFIRKEECFQIAPRSFKEYTTLKTYRLAGTSTSVADASVADASAVDTSAVDASVAGTSVAGTSVAGTSVAGTSVDNTYSALLDMSIQLYEKGYSGIDLINYIEKDIQMNNDLERKFHILFFFQKVKREFRNEKTFILFILHFLYFRSEKDLENISFM